MRRQRMRRCSRARPAADLGRWREPRCAFAKGFGDSSKLPSESTAKDWRPRSIPATGPSTGCGSSRSTSTARDIYQRSVSRLSVAERMRPRNLSALSLGRTQPRHGNVTERRSTLMLPVSRKESRHPCLRRKRGKPTRRPSLRPRVGCASLRGAFTAACTRRPQSGAPGSRPWQRRRMASTCGAGTVAGRATPTSWPVAVPAGRGQSLHLLRRFLDLPPELLRPAGVQAGGEPGHDQLLCYIDRHESAAASRNGRCRPRRFSFSPEARSAPTTTTSYPLAVAPATRRSFLSLQVACFGLLLGRDTGERLHRSAPAVLDRSRASTARAENLRWPAGRRVLGLSRPACSHR